MQSDYLVFEVVFGPGRMGIKMKSRKQVLAEGEKETEVVYLENVPDTDITIIGPGKKVPLLKREPVILAVNGSSVTGKSLKQIVKILTDAARPLTLRLQIGVTPAGSVDRSSRVSLTPVAEAASEEVSSNEVSPVTATAQADSPVCELNLDVLDMDVSPVERGALSPRLSPVEDDGSVRRYYRDRSKRHLVAEDGEEKQEDEPEEDDETVRRDFYEDIRIQFLLEMCELFEGYSKFIRRRALEL